MPCLNTIPPDAFRVFPDDLCTLTSDILCRLDLPSADAKHIADCLVAVDLRGVVSHGTRQLRRYVKEFQTRQINPCPQIRLVQETPVNTVFDGDGGAGYLVATQATEAVIQKARSQGVAMAATRNHGHVGSCGIYAQMALKHNLVTWTVAGGRDWTPPTRPDATVWEAMKSPPMCFAIPAAQGPPLVLDMNTTMFKGRDEVQNAMQTFPDPVFKSLGIRFISTILAGAMAGLLPSDHPTPQFAGASRGFFIVAVHPGHIGNLETFTQEVSRIISESLKLNPLPGLDTADVPGSREWKREQAWAKEGIPINRDHQNLLSIIARDVNVQIPW